MWAYRRAEQKKWADEVNVMAPTIMSIFWAIIGTIGFFYNFTKLINPGYFALQEIISLFK